MESTKQPRLYRRIADGVVGIGHILQWGGIEQASISWPDREAERKPCDILAYYGIADVGPVEYSLCGPVEAKEPEAVVAPVDPEPVVGEPEVAEVKAEEPAPVAPEPEVQPDNVSPIVSEADAIRNYLHEHGTGVTNKEVIAALAVQGVAVSSSQVSRIKASI